MRAVIAVVCVALVGTVVVAGPQQPPAVKVPQKGDGIVVKGCLKGSALESTETGLLDADQRMMTALVYRLTGDKSTLKQMRQQHEGHLVEVTGILKSTLPPADEIGGKTFGNTRVRIGIGSSNVGSQANPGANRSIPVLEVKSYEGLSVKCSG